MHVAIVGAGALGCVYGAYLVRAGMAVTLVVRPGKVADARPIRLERTDEGDAYDWQRPARAADVPGDADVVLVCVRHEQLDEALFALLERGPDAPLVVVTPMMPQNFETMSKAFPGRVVTAMPSVVAYVRGDVVRYWLPSVTATLLEEPRPALPVIDELARALTAAGIKTRLELGVHEANPATTVSFIPVMMALDAAGGIDPLLGDDALLDLAFRANDEGRALAEKIGKVATGAIWLLRFVGPRTLRWAVKVARGRAPEAVSYVEEHFGRKLHAQNVAMAEEIVALARLKGTPHAALDELLARLQAHDPLAGTPPHAVA